jgi:hypothetical protein
MVEVTFDLHVESYCVQLRIETAKPTPVDLKLRPNLDSRDTVLHRTDSPDLNAAGGVKKSAVTLD